MSRIDAAWRRASGELVDELPATTPTGGSPTAAITTAHSVGENIRNGSRLVPVPSSSAAPVPQPVRQWTPASSPPALRGKLVGTPETGVLPVEQYKRLAAALHELQVGRAIKSLMISSALPREGKTLTTANLALTLSGSLAQRVLVIDADLYRPSIHEMFGLGNERGLAEALQSDVALPVQRVSAGLSVVTAGRTSEMPTGVLTSDRLRVLVAGAAAHYDWILVDTPPVAMLTDAQFVARATDGILFVIAAGATPYALVQRSLADLGLDRVIGTVLNRVAERTLPVRTYYHQHYAPRG